MHSIMVMRPRASLENYVDAIPHPPFAPSSPSPLCRRPYPLWPSDLRRHGDESGSPYSPLGCFYLQFIKYNYLFRDVLYLRRISSSISSLHNSCLSFLFPSLAFRLPSLPEITRQNLTYGSYYLDSSSCSLELFRIVPRAWFSRYSRVPLLNGIIVKSGTIRYVCTRASLGRMKYDGEKRGDGHHHHHRWGNGEVEE